MTDLGVVLVWQLSNISHMRKYQINRYTETFKILSTPIAGNSIFICGNVACFFNFWEKSQG